MKFVRIASFLLLACFVAACASTSAAPPGRATAAARAAMQQEIKSEPQGAYFVGRRYFKMEYKFWGFVRPSGRPWTEAKLVMLNENQKLAPDRAAGKLGMDNNYEYKLIGYFSGEMVYEPASNGFYPEFVLKSYELRSATPAPIYREAKATDPNYRIIPRPY